MVVTFSLADDAVAPPRRPIKDGPLYRGIRRAPETHTTVPMTFRMPSLLKMLIASTLKIVLIRVLFRIM
jgi:hypothetical protein